MYLHSKSLGDAAAWVIQRTWQKHLGARYNAKTNTICRFYPSCSDYAVSVFKKYGLARGLFIAANRVRRCNPNNTDSSIDYP
jgi:putative component of membrane protein insertase Oxa1/YidC/SpoIIIJ protein YidD